jgi:hypothetical protein
MNDSGLNRIVPSIVHTTFLLRLVNSHVFLPPAPLEYFTNDTRSSNVKDRLVMPISTRALVLCVLIVVLAFSTQSLAACFPNTAS